MCDPVTLAVVSTTVSATSAYLGFQGANQAAASARTAANLNYAETYNAEQERAGQIGAQASENAVTALISRTAAQGRISASASSTGLDDPTVTAAGNASAFSIGRALSIENLNSENQRRQVATDLSAADLSRQSKIIANPGEGAASLVLGLAKAGLQGANTFQQFGGRFGSDSSSASLDRSSRSI